LVLDLNDFDSCDVDFFMADDTGFALELLLPCLDNFLCGELVLISKLFSHRGFKFLTMAQ